MSFANTGFGAIFGVKNLKVQLREETEYHPKPLVEAGGYPMIGHIMKLYA